MSNFTTPFHLVRPGSAVRCNVSSDQPLSTGNLSASGTSPQVNGNEGSGWDALGQEGCRR